MKIKHLLLAFCALVAVFGCATSSSNKAPKLTAAPGAEDFKWPDKNTPEGKFAGRYTSYRGPDLKGEDMTMTLQPNMTCLISIEYVLQKKPNLVFKGTWTATNDAATCTFTEIGRKPANEKFVFKFDGNDLVTEQHDETTIGKGTLRFVRASGGPIGN